MSDIKTVLTFKNDEITTSVEIKGISLIEYYIDDGVEWNHHQIPTDKKLDPKAAYITMRADEVTLVRSVANKVEYKLHWTAKDGYNESL